MPLAWPSILVPSSENWNPNKGASRGGGRGLTNQEQVVVGPSGYNTATLTIPCMTRARVLAMRALLAGFDGRAGSVFVGPFEVTRAPWFVDPDTGGKITYGQGAKDAALDPAWATNPDTSSRLDFQVGAAAAMNATSITIQRNRGGFLEPGMMFSIGNRLHLITALTTADPVDPDTLQAGAGAVGIAFRPWLRADYPVGTPIEFGRPLGTMGLATDDTGAMELQLSRLGTVTLDLVEKF
ncbi:hypothetical protein ACFZ8E_05755 [Methylobacterium sp. HMF5984]|uniref:hypothetical protein n=1 Tax=Methylobacterium sp. HMF5984 TaxID=3367370 RepID=UPI003853F2EF